MIRMAIKDKGFRLGAFIFCVYPVVKLPAEAYL